MNEPDSKAYGDSWYAATMVDVPPRPPLSLDLDVDVCVIGGGLAGLTTAREVARRGWSVVLLERGRLAQSASGRNTGFVLPGFGADADKLVARVGFERSKDLWSLAQAGLDYVRRNAQSEAAGRIDAQNGWLYVSKKDNSDEFVDYVALLGELGCEIEGWQTERVRAVLRSERYFNAINYLQAMTVHPLNYALALAAAAERDGARIFEHTPALSIDPAGIRKRIVTPGARLRADHVVLCGNVELGGLLPRLAATLIPMTTYVITTAPLGEKLTEAVGYPGGISDSDHADNHYRIVGGDRMMLSGRATAWVRDVRHYVGALTGDIKKTYPQLGDVTAEYAWNGTLGLTVHRMPQIGELGPGVWLASGFGGHGLNTTAMAGNLIARAVVEGDQTWRQFTPFELVWAGGVFGRAAAQARAWIKRLRNRIEARRAKARELMHRQMRDAEAARAARQAAAALSIQETEQVTAPLETVQAGTTQQEGVLQEPLQEEPVVQGPVWQEPVSMPASLPADVAEVALVASDQPDSLAPTPLPVPSGGEELAPTEAADTTRPPLAPPKRKMRRASAKRKSEQAANQDLKP
ncbi:MAG TPA: FAD-binding oxidoreductase [Xanthobacteraceae bacterium]|jgi:glycine/D-amino acid oxidase-like deaminating enzyme|nr:FAD-binding oxidoreductase [Xanthobacteraceae bacterium]